MRWSNSKKYWVGLQNEIIEQKPHFEGELVSKGIYQQYLIMDRKETALLKKEYVSTWEARGWVLFDSKFEAQRFIELSDMVQSGKIANLKIKPPFTLQANGVRIGLYTPDFSYKDSLGIEIVEECKGYMTPEASLRIRVFLALFPTVYFNLNSQKKSKKNRNSYGFKRAYTNEDKKNDTKRK